VSVFVGVNTLYLELMRHPLFSILKFDRLKLSVAGGMSVTKGVADRWHAKTKKHIILGYGLTECSPVVAINPLSSPHFTGSIGLPVPSTDIAIMDDDGKVAPLGEAGELWVSGPQVMQGYWQRPKETADVLSGVWLRTGDVARLDREGYLYLIDRKKDMILVSGFNVYPVEVEEVIASHPGVAEVAVIGIPHGQSGEAVKAIIVRKDLSLTEQDIRHFCQERLTGYKQPKIITFCDALPKSPVGKVLKNVLKGKIT
jgi:long-chain acyl-CoA synthetase